MRRMPATAEELLAEISALLGVDVLEVRRYESAPGRTICSQHPCGYRRAPGVDRCGPPCDLWRPASGRRWQLRTVAMSRDRMLWPVEVPHGDIRSPARLAHLAVRLGARRVRRYTVEDGRRLAALMHAAHEATAPALATTTKERAR